MARYKESVCRLCRREGQKLLLKGIRCNTSKCAFERRAYPPGQHGQRRPKVTDYGTQLRAKQRVKRTYGVLEKPFRAYFAEAERQRGITGENLLMRMELRLDNVVYRLGLAASRAEARQLVRHNHFLVNGKRVSIPSIKLRSGDQIEVKESSRNKKPFQLVLENGVPSHHAIPSWLESDIGKLCGTLTRLPVRDDVPDEFKEQLIVELYSK